MRGVQTAPMGLDRAGNAPPGAAPPTEIVAQATVLAEGTQGHLRGVALDHFEVGSRFPQAYEIGVKEVWKVSKPLDRIMHTLGWPLRGRAKYGEVGGSFIYPMGPDHICIGFVAGLEYADSGLSPHDVLQEFKTHPFVRRLLEGAERVAWGAKTIPSGGFHSIPDTLALPGAVLTGDSAGLVNIPRLKGVHYAMHSGMLAAETIFRGLQAGADLAEPGALADYDTAVRKSRIGKDLHRYRNLRQALSRGAAVGTPIAGLMDLTRGVFPGGAWGQRDDAEVEMQPLGPPADRAGRRAHVRQALVRVPVRQPHARRPAEPHPDPAARAARGRPHVGEHVPRGGVRDRRGLRDRRRPGARADGAVELRAVRCDHRQGRPPDAARGRLGTRVHPDVAATSAAATR